MGTLYVEQSTGNQFTVGFSESDTILDIKQRIHSHLGIPVANQVLSFNGVGPMYDEVNVSTACYSLDVYCIHLAVNIQLMVHITDTGNRLPSQYEIKLTVRIIVDGGQQYSMDQDVTLPISRLRKRITDIVRVPANCLTLSLSNGTKLEDIRTLADYGVSDGSVVDVGETGMQEVRVKSMCGTKAITVKVRASDRISELRRELGMAKDFPLPNRYFFIHGQDVVYDESCVEEMIQSYKNQS